ncbi:type II restriction endonuclease HpaII [Marivirga tractuosa]|uniref:Type II site-specific deoxyribonuclease n=1 Tax=Marivirga tractuosa (strain ATCC 23168 / DSM 4126 / NBRC 15989 / NCIMB 1408 / VKM B-1430 / H-43) TaxID=643867 RepID=E4TNH7_MARTH|nr:HpaII family restriction endonuclease [Marivirga tractuosa]ADR20434.1 Type II site-specific deoxyribonuclease [Marivirga tractuosa DSM 4126]BDD15121.1 type II restriction endonuclease HpaII [Marivirga tractuosa]
MYKGNKGEWSELYVFFQLLSEGKLYSADEKLERNGNFVEVQSIKRNDFGKPKDYKIETSGNVNIVDSETGNILRAIPRAEIVDITRNLIRELKQGKGKAFGVSSSLEANINSFMIEKVSESYGLKGDINLYIYDPVNSILTDQKFSIKSLLGSNPTAFNANPTTNIIYEILTKDGKPLEENEIIEINEIDTRHKYIDRVRFILDNYSIHYRDYQGEVFKLNLQLIDSSLPEIIASAVLNKYAFGITKFNEVIEKLNDANPCNYNLKHGHSFYEYRLINFMVESSLGMTSATVWSGEYDVIGGIIIVKGNEEVVSYHLIDFNKFKKYLLDNCRLDNPSGSKMGYGTAYIEEGKSYIKLNFQVKV